MSERIVVKISTADVTPPRLDADTKQNFTELERFLLRYTEQMDLSLKQMAKYLQSAADMIAAQTQAFSEYKVQSDAKQKELEGRLATLESLLTSGG